MEVELSRSADLGGTIAQPGTFLCSASFGGMPYLVEILLPVAHGRRSRTNLDLVRDELTAEFGGVTLQINSPAEGLWEDGGDVERDRIVMAEVMIDDIDYSWWSSYRGKLEARFRQEKIVIRATSIERL
ncbi:hypothetical protein [Rhizobium redzepovicii]|uniref:hypothetical protein n=1 Tax=Rhizobium TaxID=379 RepID=UPI0026C7B337